MKLLPICQYHSFHQLIPYTQSIFARKEHIIVFGNYNGVGDDNSLFQKHPEVTVGLRPEDGQSSPD